MSEHTFPFDYPHPVAGDVLQAAILHHLLTRHPARLTPQGIAREFTGRAPKPLEAATVGRAIAGLVRDGLADVKGGTVGPSGAARRFDRLMLGGGAREAPPPN